MDFSGKPSRTVAIVSWVFFGLGAFVMALTTFFLARLVHAETCGPNPPVGFRLTVLFVSLGIWCLPAAIAIVFLRRNRTTADASPIALVMAIFVFAVPFITLFFSAFAIAMC